MPVPQTLAKKLNKDVFQEGKERSDVHTERRWAHVSDALQAGEEARTGVCFREWGGRRRGKKPLHQAWQIQISIFNCCFGDESWEEQAEDGMNRWVKRNGYTLTECLLAGWGWKAAVLSRLQSLDTLIRVGFRWWIRQKNQIKSQWPQSLHLYNQSLSRLDTLCAILFSFFFKWSNLPLSDRCAQAY